MTFRDSMERIGQVVDVAGVAVMVIGLAAATVLAVTSKESGAERYRAYRQRLGQAILLGLELLVAADIIRTVAVQPTFETAGVLAIVVVIRTTLSFSLEMELSGRWPWQRSRTAEQRAD